MNNFDNEVPKHRRKQESSVSKAVNKSRHKHKYKDCLFIDDKRIHKGAYCTICGKIKQFDFCEELEKTANGWKTLSNYELLKKYSDLEKVTIESYFKQKYIDVPEEK